MTIKPFDDSRSVCDKCGRSGNSREAFHDASDACPLEAAEHVHYTCNICGHEWVSAPADTIVPG